jgi:hypothetical protein
MSAKRLWQKRLERPMTSNREDMIGLRSWLYLSQGMIMEGIRAAGKDLEGKPNHAPLWQITYPWAYAARIKEQGQLRKVDPYLIHASHSRRVTLLPESAQPLASSSA